MAGWIGVDLDGTLAHYDGWATVDHIGPPVPLMLKRVQGWLDKGIDVRIFTARVSDPDHEIIARLAIEAWCLVHIGKVLPVTNKKDYEMIALYDDRAVNVGHNTGVIVFDTVEY